LARGSGQIEVAQDFVVHYLPPEIAGRVKVNSLRIRKHSSVNQKLKERFSDLLYEAELKN
jgi:hypothetical protein